MESETLWKRLKQGLREGASTAAEKAEYLGKLGRARLDIAKTRHAIHDSFAELGGLVYSQIGQSQDTSIFLERDSQSLILKIKEMENQLKRQEDCLQKMKPGNTEETGA